MKIVGTNGMRRLEHVAKIVGPSSAAAQALAEYARRSKAGEEVVILEGPHSLLVGPRP